MSAVRRPLVVATVLALVTLVASTVTGAASAADVEPAAPVAQLASAAAPTDRVSSLVAVSPAALDAATAASGAVAANRPPCEITAKACVSLSARKAWLTDGAGHIVYGPVGVLGGRRGEPTPVGTFTVSKKDADYHSREFDAPMPYSVFIAPGIAFHTGSLSTRSAGCLHLSNTSAKRFFATLNPGDEVQVLR